jgi:hypothetical protein
MFITENLQEVASKIASKNVSQLFTTNKSKLSYPAI